MATVLGYFQPMKKIILLSISVVVAFASPLAIANQVGSPSREKPYVELVLPASEKLSDQYLEYEDGQMRNLSWGDLEEVVTILSTENDNFLLGGGSLIGLKKEGRFEGDDFGKTAAFVLSRKARFAKGTFELSINSDLFTEKAQVDGASFNEKGEQYVRALNVDRASMSFQRDINNSFVRLKFEFASIDDQHGFALAVQRIYHDLANEAGLGGRHDHRLDYRQNSSSAQASILLGHRFILYKNKKFQVQAVVALGTGEDSTDRFTINYDARLLLEFGQFQIALIHQRDSLQKSTGAEVIVPLRTTCNNQLAIKAGVAQVEIEDRQFARFNDDDLQHTLGIQYTEKLQPDCE